MQFSVVIFNLVIWPQLISIKTAPNVLHIQISVESWSLIGGVYEDV